MAFELREDYSTSSRNATGWEAIKNTGKAKGDPWPNSYATPWRLFALRRTWGKAVPGSSLLETKVNLSHELYSRANCVI